MKSSSKRLLLLLLVMLVSGCATFGGSEPAPPADDAPEPDPAGAETQPDGAAQPTPEIDVDPAVRASFDAAIAMLRAEQFEQAAAAFAQLVAEQPELISPHVNLGIAYTRLGREQDARQALERALALDPDHPQANNQLGILHREAGRFGEARAAYQKILSAHPDYSYAHLNMGILCDLYLRDMECALTHYERFQELSAEEDKQVGIWIADLRKRTGSAQPAVLVE